MPNETPRDRLREIADNASLSIDRVEQVYRLIVTDRAYSSSVILREMSWFYSELGLDHSYFLATRPQEVARHIQALYAAKILSRTSGENIGLRLISEHADGALYACRDDHTIAVEIERRFAKKYPDFRLQCYRTRGTTSPDSEAHLRLYLLSRPRYAEADPAPGTTDIQRIGARSFLARVGEGTRERYQELIRAALENLGPCIQITDRPEKQVKQILVAHRRGSTHDYFSAISDVLNSYGLHSLRKYIEQFSNGTVVYCIYVAEDVPQDVLEQLREDLSLVYVLPRTALTPLFQQGVLSAQEVVYAYAAWKFAHQFLTRYREEYVSLASALADDPVRLGLLSQLKHRLAKDTFTEDRLLETIETYPLLIKQLYADFADYHFASPERTPKAYDRTHGSELLERLLNAVPTPIDQQIISAFVTFNRHVLTTNFYKDTKVALSFRIDPSFLDPRDYPDRPYRIFYIVGSEFRGFHVRFRDVGRGGIRIIRSPTAQSYNTNVDQLFNEAYQLARTQQKKNKDIPDGGAKGAILLAREHQQRAEIAFKKYIDSVLDLLLPSSEIVDHTGESELLFLGPDEGTAELMDWASLHARGRGYRFWRAFTTGKSQALGGIPHDTYGMTTRSVHQYVVGILDKLGIDERVVTKLQTGGPDGDLGSNEIKISNDRTIGVIDGSGVLYDPNGLDRHELCRLAQTRQPVQAFDRSKLGAQGFLVTVDDRNVKLPNGTVVESGFALRDRFHLHELAKADLFVPCGGRPDSVHINNVHQLFDAQGRPHFRFIVEGANLFFTQEARLALEQAGVVLFKDASANKGGVTSSALEVLAALALDDEEYAEHMAVIDGRRTPPFYEAYVVEVQARIEENARLELECIWREHARLRTPRSVLTDVLSDKINAITDDIQLSPLWDNLPLRRAVLREACPQVLLQLTGLDPLLARVPEAYLKAMFAAHLASRYVYTCGVSSGEIQFLAFLQPYLSDTSAQTA